MFARVFLSHQIDELSKIYNVYILTNKKGSSNLLNTISKEVNVINVPIKREINFIYDLYVLFYLLILFRKEKFILVHSANPKAGLLSAIASWLARTPNRLHTYTGQVWATQKGFKRRILRFLDRLISILNTQILVDSKSQKDFLAKEGVFKKEEALVLGHGSISGVDANRFKPSAKVRNSVRKKFGISNDSVVFLFVGRLKKEKGVFELVRAFKSISNNKAFLLIIGPNENNLKNELTNLLDEAFEYAKFIDFSETPEIYMMASDIFVMPSHREGFGTSVIEAAACGIPSIGSNIYGLTDSIKDGETGLLTSVNSESELEKAMVELLKNENLRYQMGSNARKYATEFFSQEKMTIMITNLYKKII